MTDPTPPVGDDTFADPSGPLTDVRIVELAGLGPAQFGCLLLSDLGADVILVDRPVSHADTGLEGDPRKQLLSRGRRSIALDLKEPADLATAWSLIESADVLIDPYRPGVTERLGVGPDPALERNPRLIYARMTGWGQEGPLAHVAGHDINYVALAGALEPMGDPAAAPSPPLNLVGDFGGGGMLLAFGVVSALLERERSGQGQVIDVAMLDGVAAQLCGIHQLRAVGNWSDGRGRNWPQGAAPWYHAYRTADGRFVTVGSLEARFYRLLLERLNMTPEDWPQWDRTVWPRLTTEFERRFLAHDLAHWTALLEGTDVCFAPAVELGQAWMHPHNRARSTFIEVAGEIQPAPVPRFGRTPGAIQRLPPHPGEHTAEILGELTRTTG